MGRNSRWLACALIAVGLLATVACTGTSIAKETNTQPARLEPIDGTDLHRVILTAKAAERLDIQTDAVREATREELAGAETTPRTVVPYAAVLYDLNGGAFLYTSPEPLTFVRAPISVDYIKGDVAVLFDGPPLGTAVVTVGAAELFGAEFEFEEE